MLEAKNLEIKLVNAKLEHQTQLAEYESKKYGARIVCVRVLHETLQRNLHIPRTVHASSDVASTLVWKALRCEVVFELMWVRTMLKGVFYCEKQKKIVLFSKVRVYN